MQRNFVVFSSSGFLLCIRWVAAISQESNLSVESPPGTDKSAEAWMWALWKAKTADDSSSARMPINILIIVGRKIAFTTGYNANVKDYELCP